MADSKRSILIVDDEEDVIVLLQLVFETNGFVVRTAPNGKAAVSSAYENPPDVILLDVMMPEMDGWQVLRALKGDERTRNIPVAMLSARAERRDKMIGLQEGAEGYIAKPFSPSEVVREVQSLLAAARPSEG
jgi:CheY-like chemotaxis protein